MDAWLGAPLIAQNGEGFENCFGKIQKIHQDGAIKGLAGVVPVRLIGRQKFPFTELFEDETGHGQLLLAEGARIQDRQSRQLSDRQSCAALLLSRTDPPETKESERRV